MSYPVTEADSLARRPSVERTYQAEPTIIYTTEIHDTGAAAAWWVGGLVAVVAILSVTFLVTRNPNTDQQVAATAQQSRLQAALESSQSTLADTQNAARQAAQGAAASATFATSATDATQAQNADDNAVDASAHVADMPAPPPAFVLPSDRIAQ